MIRYSLFRRLYHFYLFSFYYATLNSTGWLKIILKYYCISKKKKLYDYAFAQYIYRSTCVGVYPKLNMLPHVKKIISALYLRFIGFNAYISHGCNILPSSLITTVYTILETVFLEKHTCAQYGTTCSRATNLDKVFTGTAMRPLRKWFLSSSALSCCHCKLCRDAWLPCIWRVLTDTLTWIRAYN